MDTRILRALSMEAEGRASEPKHGRATRPRSCKEEPCPDFRGSEEDGPRFGVRACATANVMDSRAMLRTDMGYIWES